MTEPNRKFETDRTRRFRAGELSESDDRTISHIEGFGCEVVQVKKTSTGPGWSYTIGIFDTCGKPDLITVGLPESTALCLLNEGAHRLRSGVNLAEGRHREMVGEVECEFRPVDPNMTEVEEEFWASADPSSSLFNWKFPDSPHTGVFLSAAVQTGAEPVTYVSHDIEDGAWQFLGDSMVGEGKPVISCFHHPVDKDPTLNELGDLPLGWCAERAKPGDPWIRREHEPEETAEQK
jgi:hypothetical protein